MTNSRFWRNLHPLIRRERKNPYEDDTNYAILNAIDQELKDLEEETVKSKIQSSLKTATGFFLEEYGDFFGVYRKTSREDDEEYRERIIEAVDIPRGTNESIKKAIRRYLENNTVGIKVYEPWKDIFYLNRPESRLSGSHKLQGDYYHFAVIDVYIGSPFGEDIVSLIDDYKPAGVTLHTTYDPSLGSVSPEDLEARPYYGYIRADNDIANIHMVTSQRSKTQGSIFMSDAVNENNVFFTNKSLVGSKNALSGGYNTYRGQIHYAGIGSDINPTRGANLPEITTSTKEVNPDFYLNRDSKHPENIYNTTIETSRHLYLGINVDTLFRLRHPKVTWLDKGYAELLGKTSFQMSIKGNINDVGSSLVVEAYNFEELRWEEVTSKTIEVGTTLLKGVLSNPKERLSLNNLILLRVRSLNRKITLGFNHFRMDYRSNVINEEFRIGYSPYKFVGNTQSENIIEKTPE